MLRQLGTMVASDLRQRVRDRSVLIIGVVVPLVLMYVFNLVFADTNDLELEPLTVAVAAPENDELAARVPQVLGEADLGELVVTVRPEPGPEQVRDEVEAGAAGLGLILPTGFGDALRSGDPTQVRAIRGAGQELESSIALSVVDGTLEQLAAGAQAAAAAARAGLPPEDLAAVARQATTQAPPLRLVQGTAAQEQLGAAAALVAGQTGLFLLFTVGFGVLGLVQERESGTLARLQSMPMRPGLVVAAKAAVSAILGIVATTILLTAGGLLFGVGFGPVPLVAVLVVAVVAATTSLMFVIVRVARTSEQAGIAQSITALVLGIAGGAFFPVAAPGWLGGLLDLNPVAAFIRGLGITAGGGGVGDLVAPLVTLAAFAVAMVLVSRLLPDRGLAT